MSNIEKIRQEIERRKTHFNKEATKYQYRHIDYANNCFGARDALRDLLALIDSLPKEEPSLAVEDIKKIVKIADGLLDDPKARVEFNNHNEEYYYQKVLDEYNRLHQTAEE